MTSVAIATAIEPIMGKQSSVVDMLVDAVQVDRQTTGRQRNERTSKTRAAFTSIDDLSIRHSHNVNVIDLDDARI